jgi:nucleoid DNA-binding protein
MIEKYISELLYKYDNVILPGFGAFILKNFPASINPLDNKLAPPSSHVTFDPSSKNNDGILANYISEKEKISFFDACNKILLFTEEIIKSLSEGKTCVFQKIGTFTTSTDNSISFTPDVSVNYNLETIGMGELVSSPIARDDKKSKPGNNDAENSTSHKGKRKHSKVAIWIICITVILGIGIAVILIVKPYILFNKENRKIVVTKESSKKKNQSNRNEKTLPTDTLKKQDTTSKIVDNNPVNSSEQATSEKYYIISASFRIKENAMNYMQTLKQKGYGSDMIFLEDRGLYVVSYNVYTSETEAEQSLTKIKPENSVAWILKHQ